MPVLAQVNKLTFPSQLPALGRSHKFIWQLKQQTGRVQESTGLEKSGSHSQFIKLFLFLCSFTHQNLCYKFHLHFNVLGLDITICFSESFLSDSSSTHSAVPPRRAARLACIQQIRRTWDQALSFLPTQPLLLTSVFESVLNPFYRHLLISN